jgi:hypothetical protein
MSEFTNVTIVKEANIYFEGKVTSRSILFPDGSKKTLGVMLPGEYEFNTDQKEIMEIISGGLEVLLPGSDNWKWVEQGETFEVPAQSKFGLKVKRITDYCCSFVS